MAAEPAARLTPMGVMVLALLAEGDMHPYEMKRLMLSRHEDRLLAITNGTLYHTVARLEQEGLLAEVGIDRDGNRPERTTYRRTGAGRAALEAWVRRELPRIDRPDRFRIAVAESHNLEAAEALDLLRARGAALRGEHAELTGGLAGAREQGVPAQFILELERQAALVATDLSWNDALVARLEHGEIPWGPAGFDTSDRYQAQRKAAQQ